MTTHPPLEKIRFITEFLDFARSKGEATYVSEDPRNCALAQFGYPDLIQWSRRPKTHVVPYEAYEAAIVSTTFTALAKRLEVLLAEPSVIAGDVR